MTLLAMAVWLGGCVQSVNPLHTADTVVLEPALLGTWVFDDGDLLIITQRDSTSYRVVSVASNGQTGVWVGWVTALGDRRWLDVHPEDLPAAWSDSYRDAFLPLYTFWALLDVGERLRVATLNYDSLHAALTRDPAALAHAEGVDNRILLTASTTALRRYVAAFAERPGALDEAQEPARRAPSRP